jgi:hypothetical protein
MNTVPKVGNIDEEDNILTTKIKLTKNEYNATIRNKLEYNRLRIIKRHLGSQSDLNACKIRTSMHDLKKWLGDNQRVVCNIDEFFMTRKVRRFYLTISYKSLSLFRLNQHQHIIVLVYQVFVQVFRVLMMIHFEIDRNPFQSYLDHILPLFKHTTNN